MNSKLSPMKMIPSFKDYLWGGERLVKEFGKNTPMRPLAESWEISCHPDAPCKISTGSFAGSTLMQVLEKHPEYIASGYSGEFPILIKLIDAKQSLSVQVHPNNAYAQQHENQLGKNEMWYVIAAQKDASLIVGFKEEISKDEIKKKIANDTILEVANTIQVKAGDCFEIPAGMLHAIGKGILIAEVQQSSNVTYRVYDYNRRDKDGNARELHIDKAVDVIDSGLKAINNSGNKPEQFAGYAKKELTSWRWFKCYEYDLLSEMELLATKDSFHAVLVIEGGCQINYEDETVSLSKGESLFIPASMGEYTVKGRAKFILTTL